jgi:hypothetical protein
MLGVAMPQRILHPAQSIAAVGQDIAAAVAEHRRMDVQRQTRAHPGNPHQVMERRARQLVAALVQTEPGQLDIATLRHGAFERPECLGVERLRRGYAPCEALHPEAPVGAGDILAPEAAECGDAQPMLEGAHEHGRMAPAVARTRGPSEQQGKCLFAESVSQALRRIHRRRLRRTVDLTPHGRDASPVPIPDQIGS